MKRINITKDVTSRLRIANGQPSPVRVIEQEVKKLKVEDAKSKESEGAPPDTVQSTEKPSKKTRTAKENL